MRPRRSWWTSSAFHNFLLWVTTAITAVRSRSAAHHHRPLQCARQSDAVAHHAQLAARSRSGPSFRSSSWWRLRCRRSGCCSCSSTSRQPDLTVKATGKQWYWSYNYPDNGNFEFDSLIVADKDLKPGQPRLLTVDNELVVPVNKVVHVLVTGADVIHSFAVPSFGIKIDAVPGRLNDTWFKATSEGLFHGQCSELCGKDHAFMPITVRVVSDAEFADMGRDGEEERRPGERCRRPHSRRPAQRRTDDISRCPSPQAGRVRLRAVANAGTDNGYDDTRGTRRRQRTRHSARLAPLRLFDEPQGHRHDVPRVRAGRRPDRRHLLDPDPRRTDVSRPADLPRDALLTTSSSPRTD